MRIFFFAIPVVLGISIFLLGLKLMTAALETLLGFRLRSALIRFTEARTKGFLLGLLVTAFIQSSSAVGAALVVLADTGVLSLTQALGVMLGANVGTTVTAQIVALPLESLALPLCAVGLAVRYGAKRRRMGTALFGLGAVFFLSLLHNSEPPRLRGNSYSVLCLQKKNNYNNSGLMMATHRTEMSR